MLLTYECYSYIIKENNSLLPNQYFLASKRMIIFINRFFFTFILFTFNLIARLRIHFLVSVKNEKIFNFSNLSRFYFNFCLCY